MPQFGWHRATECGQPGPTQLLNHSRGAIGFSESGDLNGEPVGKRQAAVRHCIGDDRYICFGRKNATI